MSVAEDLGGLLLAQVGQHDLSALTPGCGAAFGHVVLYVRRMNAHLERRRAWSGRRRHSAGEGDKRDDDVAWNDQRRSRAQFPPPARAGAVLGRTPRQWGNRRYPLSPARCQAAPSCCPWSVRSHDCRRRSCSSDLSSPARGQLAPAAPVTLLKILEPSEYGGQVAERGHEPRKYLSKPFKYMMLRR